eukprot:CAMPEP_0117032824 /NCGR_PEP_ID=MMETSP0472-20121206/23504_1 /TAXON_ID=693140 ORGANISM="Tiarina fusus, Strain LIS" /NCGR_SAMPLE_ID=MMETSP0472 /ASSEMBLY_ACC=CAM_ASM_000603 /LENGTH=210 /DNA_ID=CAMNT_0004741579 /DNA_START=68 /DNA_END=701 /DNA_ORIENTATION=+
MITITYLVALVACAISIAPAAVDADAFVGGSSSHLPLPDERHYRMGTFSTFVAGAAAVEIDEDDTDLEIESSDEEEYEEEEEVLDPKLAKSAQSSAAKQKARATATAKAAISAKLDKPSPKKKSSLLKIFKIPYIVKALVNPFVVWQMTKGYFASLVNLNYLEENKDPSQDLRSALEAKAKKGGSSGSRGKRKMKPGQAKTLSDLPQLNT